MSGILYLYNTRSKAKEAFEPLSSQEVKVYVCGPTVYSGPHIGNARSALTGDLLVRVLRGLFHNVKFVRNITDVDDKVLAKARECNMPSQAVSKKFADVFHEDMRILGALVPGIEPWATEHIPAIISVIERLLARGCAYEGAGEGADHVFFDVARYKGYGSLSKKTGMMAGARVEAMACKKNAADFVLWKPEKEKGCGWESPWGYGRPGWHTECVAMIEAHLGVPIDIHAGGADLLFPHHENEEAQAACLYDQPLARFWVHNGFVNVRNEKMSKSLGNVVLLSQLLDDYAGDTIRLAFYLTHYRQSLEWDATTLPHAQHVLDVFARALRDFSPSYSPDSLSNLSQPQNMPQLHDFVDALYDDLNTPQALTHLLHIAKRILRKDEEEDTNQKPDCHASSPKKREKEEWQRALRTALSHLGFSKTLGKQRAPSPHDEDNEANWVSAKIRQRDEARSHKDFTRADAIRDELFQANIQLEDTPEGTQWYYRDPRSSTETP